MALASLMAGFVDAIVGGGGLILVPALFAILPQRPPRHAVRHQQERVDLGHGDRHGAVQPARADALALAGARRPGGLCRRLCRRLGRDGGLARVPAQAAAASCCSRCWSTRWPARSWGSTTRRASTGARKRWAAAAIGLVIGFYDGFFGPGTGSFLVFLFVRWLGYDFLHASASAKLLNTATNLAALILFALKGHVWWHYALALALANVAGSLLGTRLALQHGAGFVRGVFIVVVSALILKTGYDAFLR